MPQESSIRLRIDPVPVLLSCGYPAIEYFSKRDLISENVAPIDCIWQLPEVQKMLRKQQPNGTWKYSGKEVVTYPCYHYELVETWKNLHILVENYEADRRLESVRKAAEFIFSCQTSQGDIRGMIANQYATYYTGAMLAILIKAGYSDDPRVTKGMDWLLSMRQTDGGWTIPLLTHEYTQAAINKLTSTYAEPAETDCAKPFSHNWTDMVLRAFAAHPNCGHKKEVHVAADLLKSTFFQPDVYASYQDARYWVRFRFWWPNLVTALDSLSLLGYPQDDPDVIKGLKWLIENQLPDGLWKLDYCKTAKSKETPSAEQYWLALRVARIFKRFNEK